jgi:hypothetical protein
MCSLVAGYKRFGRTYCLHRVLVTLYCCSQRHVPKDHEFDAAVRTSGGSIKYCISGLFSSSACLWKQ